jgi:hypothetical protein
MIACVVPGWLVILAIVQMALVIFVALQARTKFIILRRHAMDAWSENHELRLLVDPAWNWPKSQDSATRLADSEEPASLVASAAQVAAPN